MDQLMEMVSCEINILNETVTNIDNHSEELLINETRACSEQSYEYPNLFSNKTLFELCSSSWSRSPKATGDVQPYLRGCKWSPDGTCCLSVVNNDGIHITELPRDLYTGTVANNRTINVLDSIIHVNEAGLVYDFCWFPAMNSYYPETCSWLTTIQNAPIQMWDAFDGSLRCSYRGYNAFDEMEPAISITYTLDCTKIIAGYKKTLKTFEVERPGREYAEHKIQSPASCITTLGSTVAVGSWNAAISLYKINETGTYKSIGKMHGHSGGITHLKFTPDGVRLVSGARKDHRLLIWDIRYHKTPLNVLTREVNTNQRIYFDISPCGKYLVTGGTDGVLKVWSIDNIDNSSLNYSDNDNATFKFPLHRDCCNSVSVHPSRPIIATGSGQYHFVDPLSGEDEHLENGKPKTIDNFELNSVLDMKYSSECENNLTFWWVSDVIDLPMNECK